MDKRSTETPIRRLIKVAAVGTALLTVLLAPVYAVSVLTTDNAGTTQVDDPRALETVLVSDLRSDNQSRGDLDAFAEPYEESDALTFTIEIDDRAAQIVDTSDIVTFTFETGSYTFESGSADGTERFGWIDSDCHIYMAPDDSADAALDDYTKFSGVIRVHDAESRTTNDGCGLYWIDPNAENLPPSGSLTWEMLED